MSASSVTQTGKTGEFLRAEAELLIEQAREAKAEKNRSLGDPITLKGTPINLQVRGDFAWTAENGHIVRKTDLRTGETVQVYKGHIGPVTSIAFVDSESGSGSANLMITGSWDQTIKIWDTETKALISSTAAHSDFVKTLLVLPAQRLLVSGGSDKAVRFWDLSSPWSSSPLPPVGSLSSHTRPIEALEAHVDSFTSPDGPCTLFTSDTMGVIRVWDIYRETSGGRPIWKSKLKVDLLHHRTGITQLTFGDGYLWSASTDETVQAHLYPLVAAKPKPLVLATEKKAVRAMLALHLDRQLGVGSLPYLITASSDLLRIYDVSSLEEPEFIREVEGHWHDVTSLRLWLRPRQGGQTREVWVISAGLDKTIRRWRVTDLIAPALQQEKRLELPVPMAHKASSLTEEEERELAELMEDN